MSTFVYQPLASDHKTIRLIHLQPRQENQKLPAQVSAACIIDHVPLDQSPPYAALSYAWGDANQKGCILVNGAHFFVTENLKIALEHLTPQIQPLTLWIDALCINQDDEVEKTQQVGYMKQIYSQSTSVITWLGPTQDASDVAMRWIQQYGCLAQSFGIATKPELRLGQLLKTFESDPNKLPHPGLEGFLKDISAQLSSRNRDGAGEALSKLFERPYWSRVWVVQELVHGKCVRFVCGDLVVSEELFHYSMRLLRNFSRHQGSRYTQNPNQQLQPVSSATKLDTRNAVYIFKVRRTVGPFPLMYLIRAFRNFHATDPRDMIFAFLSFAADAKVLGVYPDYQKSVRDVYVETTISLIRNGFFDILSLCEGQTRMTGLPSWVPDFMSTNCRLPLQQRAMNRKTMPLTTVLQPRFRASGYSESGDTFCEFTGASLLLRGKLVAEVKRVGSPWQSQGFQRWITELKELSHWGSLAEDTKACWRTAVADQEIRRGEEKPRLPEGRFEEVHVALESLDLSTADEQTFVSVGLKDYIYQLRSIGPGRRPFCTSKGHLGIGPQEMESGDHIYILIGAQVPYVLRPSDNGSLQLIGEVYAHGIMDGEAMDDGGSVGVISIC